MRFADIEFGEVWMVDFEFSQPVGGLPEPVCMVANELTSSRTIRLFNDELRRCGNEPPYAVTRNSLVVSYYAIAELSCHLALGWPLPVCVLDLYVEFRNLTNGLETPAGNSLLGALAWFGIDLMDAVEKDTMRQLAIRGGTMERGRTDGVAGILRARCDCPSETVRAHAPQTGYQKGTVTRALYESSRQDGAHWHTH